MQQRGRDNNHTLHLQGVRVGVSLRVVARSSLQGGTSRPSGDLWKDSTLCRHVKRRTVIFRDYKLNTISVIS